MPHEVTNLIFTGHLPDLIDRKSPRFPSDLVHCAQYLIIEYLKNHANSRIFMSLAAGADILFASEALHSKMELHLILPCSVADFIAISVAHYDSNYYYENQFHKIWAQAKTKTELTWSGSGLPDFEACNLEILKQADATAGKIEACLFVASSSEKMTGGSRQFFELLRDKKIPFTNLYTRIEEIDLQKSDFHTLIHKVREMDESDVNAIDSQRKWKMEVRFSLILFGLVAILSSLDGMEPNSLNGYGFWIKTGALIAALIAAIMELLLNPRKGKNRSQWIESRARSERIKSMFWLSFWNLLPVKETQTQFLQPEILLSKAKVILLPLEDQKSIYQKNRIKDQQVYFETKCLRLSNQLKHANFWQRAFLALGIIWGLLRLFSTLSHKTMPFLEEVNLLACLAAIAVILANYQESINTADQHFQYHQMLERMKEIEDQLLQSQTKDEFLKTVQNCEDVLAAQNNEWSIRLG